MVNTNESPTQGKVEDQSKPASIKKRSSKSPFSRVNERYEHLLANQVGKRSLELKRLVIDECISRVAGISSIEYQTALRNTMAQRLLFHFPFLMDCNSLKLSHFEAAQNVAMLNKVSRVLKEGLENVFKGKIEMLREAVFTESELAKAKFDTPASKATPQQESELSDFIERAMTILPTD